MMSGQFLNKILFLLCAIISFFSYIYADKHKKLLLKDRIVSRGAWSAYCDHVYSDYNNQSGRSFKLDPAQIKTGDTVFFTLFTFEKFFKEIHPFIKYPYIIISLYEIDRYHIERYIDDPKILAWFGMCPQAVNSKKFRMIPLGINVDRFTIQQSKHLRAMPKIKKIYTNFAIHENRNSETEFRRSIYAILRDKPCCMLGEKKPFKDFLKDMAQCAFTASPTGDMDDCFRHWEALMVGSIPIIPKYNHNNMPCAVTELLNDLPVIFVDDYSQITENFLKEKHREILVKRYNLKKIYMAYWMNEIKKIKQKLLSKKGNK